MQNVRQERNHAAAIVDTLESGRFVGERFTAAY
jgi:hypothetical protein